MHGAQHLLKKLQALANPQAAVVAVSAEGSASNVLEREIRLAILGRAGVVESRDVGMIEACEDRALSTQAFREPHAHQRRMDELQSHSTREQTVDALSQPHASHATAPKQGPHAIRPKPPPDQAPGGIRQRCKPV